MSLLQILDLVILLALVVAGIIGFCKGLSKKVFNLASIVIAIFAIFFLSSPILKLFGKDDAAVEIKCLFYAGIFIVVFVLIRILGAIFKKGVDKLGFSFFDRLFGLIWGVAFMLLIVWSIMLVCTWASKISFVASYIAQNDFFSETGWGFTVYLYKHNLLPTILEAIASGGKQ